MCAKPPKFEVDESRLEKLHNDAGVVRRERPIHLKESSFSGIPVMPGTDLLELLGRGPDTDLKNDDFPRC